MSEDDPYRPRLWVAAHENYWETWVALRPDGTYAAWAVPLLHSATEIYVEDTFAHAEAAGLFQLGSLSGHNVCGASCTSWVEREPPSALPYEWAEVKVMAKRTARKTARKSTARTKEAAKRQRISPRGDARYIPRNAKGRIKKSDGVGRSQKADRRTKAKRKVKSGQGDKGDR